MLANRFGCIENVRLMNGKDAAHLHFYTVEEASRMMDFAQNGQLLHLRGSVIRLQYANAPDLGPDVATLLAQGATRNLFVGGVSDEISEQQIRDLFGPFSGGNFDHVNILRGKKIAFVHMPSLRAATAARAALDNQSIGTWRLKVNYAREAGHGGTPHQAGGGSANTPGGSVNGIPGAVHGGRRHRTDARAPPSGPPGPRIATVNMGRGGMAHHGARAGYQHRMPHQHQQSQPPNGQW